jgi:hypothetical protein
MIKALIFFLFLPSVIFGAPIIMPMPMYNYASTPSGCDSTCMANLRICDLKPTVDAKKECYNGLIKDDEITWQGILWIIFFFIVGCILMAFLMILVAKLMCWILD